MRNINWLKDLLIKLRLKKGTAKTVPSIVLRDTNNKLEELKDDITGSIEQVSDKIEEANKVVDEYLDTVDDIIEVVEDVKEESIKEKEKKVELEEEVKEENITMQDLLDLCYKGTDVMTHYIEDNEVLNILFNKVNNLAERKDYKIFKSNNRNYNVNIWFIRNSDITVDAFNDICFLFYKEFKTNKWVGKLYKVSTNPGLYYLNNPLNKQGTAIVVPGQYIKTHKIDLHKRGTSSEHEAFCHRKGVVLVYRDNNKDSILDIGGDIYRNGAGLNSHRPTNYSQKTGKVNRSSAGCLIHATREQFDKSNDKKSKETFMGILRNSELNYGEWMSFVLDESKELYIL